MFTNKHVIIAMLVAPLLAVMAWFGVGYLTAEKPGPAQPGQSYPLVEKSNCRYDSGFCDLENEEFKLVLSLVEDSPGSVLQLDASHALDSVLLAVASQGGDEQPLPMQAVGADGLVWRLTLGRLPTVEQRIRVVALRGGVQYFVEAGTTWLDRYRGE